MQLQNPDSAPGMTKEVAAAIFAVEARCMQALQNVAASIGADFGGASSDLVGTPSDQSSGMPAMPFMAFWNVTDKKWDMYLPKNSLYVNGKPVDLPKPNFVAAGTTYLHVDTKKSPAEASIDTNASKAGCDYNLALFEIGTDKEWYAVVKNQFHLGVIILGTSGAGSGCFDPSYDQNGRITGVLRPYVMCGRKVVTATGTPAEGVNVVRVDHASDSVSATITSGRETPSNDSDTYTDIPLYKIKNGQIEEDYRNMPRVPLYDPKS